MLPKIFAFVDTETTGFRANRDRIIEIGIIRVEEGKVVEKFQTLLNPECYLPDEIEFLTGITKKDLDHAPTFYQVSKDIQLLLKDALFVAHNVRFDYGFFKNEFKRADMSFSPKQLCTVKLFKHLFPNTRRHNLDAVIDYFNLTCSNRHRAFDDAWVLWEFYQQISKKFSEELLEQAINKVCKKPSVPSGLSSEDIDNLPQNPGVYIFYGEENVPLYIGKSVNIRDRVLSHFSSDHSSPLEMKISQQVKRIETIQTSGELGALLKEASLIKKMCPLYNRKLRYARKVLCLVKSETKEGYYNAQLETIEHFTKDNIKNILGVFKSKKQAKDYLMALAKQHNLCQRLLGVESTLSECFAYRLGRCNGACKGKEKPLFYNLRFIEAFAKTKIRPWPFSAPIMIIEKNEDNESAQAFFIQDWCFLNSLAIDNASISHSLLEFVKESMFQSDNQEIPFDLDTYRILNSFIKNSANHKYITVLGDSMFSQLPLALQ